MQLSIIIVNFNTFQLCCNCIDSIEQETKDTAYEVILVDNAPAQDDRQAFLSRYPHLVYIRSEANIGFGRANNLGMQAAKAPYILLINSDTIVLHNCIGRCLHYMQHQASPGLGLLGCKLLNEDGSYQPSFYPFVHNSIWNYFITNNPFLYKLLRLHRRYAETDKTIDVGDVSGAFMLLKKEVLDRLKGFDPDFFLYCEETEWCRERIARHYKIQYYPAATTVHLGGKSAPREPMYVQSKLSLALVWYKKGLLPYLLYILATYLNLLCYLLSYYLMAAENRPLARQYIRGHLKIFPYLFTDIPKYPRPWNSRREPLVYKGARKIFFGE